MKTSPFVPLLTVVVILAALLSGNIGQASKWVSQDNEKTLNIKRHANEPLALVDLRVSENSLKKKIMVNQRRGDTGLDNVKFQDLGDWPKRIRVRLRNVSGKTIVGLQAYLYLKPPGSAVLFSVTLRGSKALEQTVLEPRDEIDATVDEGSWARAVTRLKQQGFDANLAAVTFSVGIVAFDNGVQWHKGHLLRRDPDNLNRSIPVEEKVPPGMSRLDQPPLFRTVGFRSHEAMAWGKSETVTVTPQPLQANARCVVDNGSWHALHCQADQFGNYCFSIENGVRLTTAPRRVSRLMAIAVSCRGLYNIPYRARKRLRITNSRRILHAQYPVRHRLLLPNQHPPLHRLLRRHRHPLLANRHLLVAA